MYRKRAIFDKIFKYSITVIALISTVIATIWQLYNFGFNRTKENDTSYSLKEIKNEIQDIRITQQYLKEKYNDIIKYSSSIADSNLSINLHNNFIELNKKIDKIDEKTIGLRQAINPLNPDEILTIARLKDAIDLLDNKQVKLENDLEKKLSDFRSSIIREIDSTSKATNWLFVVLIPLVLNLLYTMWKDRRETKSKSQETSN